MGLLDQILGNVLQPQQTGTGSPSSGIGGVLMNMLGGGGNRTAGREAVLAASSPTSSKLDWVILLNRGSVTAPINRSRRSSCRRFLAMIRCRPWPATPVWRLMIFCRSSASTSPAWSMA
jgi:hypothetical protein